MARHKKKQSKECPFCGQKPTPFAMANKLLECGVIKNVIKNVRDYLTLVRTGDLKLRS